MDMANAKLVMNTTQKLDVLSKRLYIQSKSFDDVVDMCKNHDEMLKCIPARERMFMLPETEQW